MFGENGTDPKGYTGDEYRVTYKSGDLPSSHEDTSNNVKTNDWTTPQDIVVTYYGVPVAEYNPQFWVVGGTATTYGLINAGVTSNWYKINNYQITEGKETIVFTGWEISGGNVEVSDPVDPGERLDQYCVNRALTLTAKWDILNSYRYSSEESYSGNPSNGTKYTNVILVNSETSLEEMVPSDESTTVYPTTIRKPPNSEVESSFLKLTEKNEKSSEAWNQRWTGDYYRMPVALIVDQLKIVGTDFGRGAQVTRGGLYACGNELIIGTGVDASSDIKDGLSVYGGFLAYDDGSINSTDAKGSTDVRIFSGLYRTVSAGSMQYNTPNYDTNLVMVGGTVWSTVYGGNVAVDVESKTDVDSSNVLIVGGSFVHDGGLGGKYEMPLNTAFYVAIMGGCRVGSVNQSNVIVSGDAKAFMVQGGGRSGSDSSTEETNVTVSGMAEVCYLVSGGVTDGYRGVKSGGTFVDTNTPVVNANVTIKDSAVIGNEGHLYEKSANNANESEDRYRGVVFGGGWDTGVNSYLSNDDGSPVGSIATPTISCKTTALSIEGGTIYGAVFGGGYRGNIGEKTGNDNGAVKVSITGGNIYGNVYGGGRGGPDRLNSLAGGTSAALNKTGVSHIYGNVVMDVSGGTVHGSIYGGGQGVGYTEPGSSKFVNFKDVGSVFGSVRINISGDAKVTKWQKTGFGGDIFCAGRGVNEGLSRDVAKVTGSVDLTINGSEVEINGSVYGGGEVSRLGDMKKKVTDSDGSIKLVDPDNHVKISLGKATIGGSVFGGGLGVKGITSTYVKDRTIDINGATIEGSIYGGSRDGDDNCSEVLPNDPPTYKSTINIASGNIASGTSSNVYGGGYAGRSYFNSTINIGVIAAKALDVPPSGTISIGSVFGGPNVGVRDAAQTAVPVLMKGTASVNIVGDPRYDSFTIIGDIFGGGDYCGVDGELTIEIKDFDQGDRKVQSIQKADSLTITDSKIRLSGSIDGSSTDGSNRMSINRIGMLKLVRENSRSEIELDYAARSISGFLSDYPHGVPSDVRDYNLIKMNNGKTFFILGEDEKGNVYGGISGNVLFQSDDNTYYGAFVIGDLSGNVDASFWILKNDAPEPATTTDYNRSSSSSGNDTRVWYISGSFRVEKVAVFDSGNSDQLSQGGVLNIGLEYVLPKISTVSGIRYMGHHMELNSPDSLKLVGSLDEQSESGLLLTFGQGPQEADLLTFNGGAGQILTDSTSKGTINSDGSGLNMKMSLQMKSGYETSGFIGSAIIHFAEMMEYKDNNGNVLSTIALGIFDVKVSVYLKAQSPVTGESTTIMEDVVMREESSGSHLWTGTARAYLPALSGSNIGHYAITGISKLENSSEPINGSLTIRSVSNDEGKDGWIDANYRQGRNLGNSLGDSIVELGTGAVYSPVLEMIYSTGQSENGSFDNVYMVVEIRGDDGTVKRTVTVHLIPEEVTNYQVTFYDKVLNADGTWCNEGETISRPDGGDVPVKQFYELFSIQMEFGKNVRDYYVAYKVPLKPVGKTVWDAVDYLESIGDYLMVHEVINGSEETVQVVAVSTSKIALESEAKSKGYLVGTVEDFLNIVIEKKPDTNYRMGNSDPIPYVYKNNSPSWNNGTAGLSRFNFERPITQEQNVYSGYGVEVTLRAVVKGEVRAGLVGPSVIIPVPDADSGKVKINVGSWKKFVTVTDGYVAGKWYLPDNESADGREIYSSTTIFIELDLKEYELKVEVGDEDNPSLSVEYAVLDGSTQLFKRENGNYPFNVESELKIKITSGNEYYRVVGVKVGGDDWHSFDGKQVSITPSAKPLEVKITTGSRYQIQVILPTEGQSDNRMFGFDDNGKLVIGTGSSSHSFLVRGSDDGSGNKVGSLELELPTDYLGRTVVYTLYQNQGPDVSGSVGDAYASSVDITDIRSDLSYSLFVNVNWKVETEQGAGFTYRVQHLSRPLGPSPDGGLYSDAVDGNIVRTGDRVLLKLVDSYMFDSSFTCIGAEWREDTSIVDADRVYVVLGGTDVVFGKAVSASSLLTIVLEFHNGNDVLRSFRVYGSANLSIGGSVVRVLPCGTTDVNGQMIFGIDDAKVGDEYTIETGFAGFTPVEKTYRVSESESWKIELHCAEVNLTFSDPNDGTIGTGVWNVVFKETLGNVLEKVPSGDVDYPVWYTGSGLIGPEEMLTVESFEVLDFYDSPWSPVLKAVPDLEDLTTPSGMTEILILLNEDELDGEHWVSVDFYFHGEITVGGQSGQQAVTCTIDGGKLTITGCPMGTGSLRFFGGNVVLTVVSISVLEDIS